MLVDFSLPYPPRGYGCILTPLRAYCSKPFASCVHPAPTKPRNQSVSESYWGAIMLMATAPPLLERKERIEDDKEAEKGRNLI